MDDATSPPPPSGDPGRRRRLIAALAVVPVALVAALLIARAGSGGAPSAPSTGGTPVAVSTEPSSWELPRLDGPGLVRLDDLRGRPLVVNLFASWCTPCRAELPLLQTTSSELAGRVRFVGVDSEEDGAGLALAKQLGIHWPIAQDVGGRLDSGLHDALGAQGMPVTAFYDAQGRLLGVKLGTFVADTLRDRLNQLYGLGLS
jgi:cytochrome c biogenesis protein CcmG/thiol:disulfide interchange protein DsbE